MRRPFFLLLLWGIIVELFSTLPPGTLTLAILLPLGVRFTLQLSEHKPSSLFIVLTCACALTLCFLWGVEWLGFTPTPDAFMLFLQTIPWTVAALTLLVSVLVSFASIWVWKEYRY
jgi:hypothetical protein